MAETAARLAYRQENEPMGRVTVEVKLANKNDIVLAEAGAMPLDQVHRVVLEGFVDTGANWLVLPATAAAQLGLPKAGEMNMRYADGRTSVRDMVELVEVELLGRKSTFRALLEPDRTTALIGAIVMEDLDLLVDCTQQRLIPRDPDRITGEVE